MMNSPFYNRNSLPAKKKVVSVPVHFISSDQPPTLMSRDSAALQIQKVFRGFLVRKSVNKICWVRKEIVNMEQRIMKKEFINSISEDPKERLRVNETLMSLLLKLDSIRGFDSGVRDFRKSVTKKAIAVQDKVDSIAQPPQPPQPDDDSNSNKENEEEEIDVEENSGVGKGGDFCAGPPSIKDGDDKEEEERRWEKMMKVMCERNEMQRRMINSLSRRVEQLEKAFVIDHLTRMNNKNQKKKKKTKSNASRRRGRRGPGWIIHDDDDER